VQHLSIIVPLLGHQPSFEETLISVLENRPRGSEVVVPCASTYSDPYQLDGEVRFIRMDGATSWVEYANAAARASCGDMIHWLWPGAHVEEGWTDAAVDALQFDDELGSVAPIVVVDDGHWAGVRYAAPGKRILQRCDRCRVSGEQRLQIDGPSFLAGSFRRSSLFDLGGWDAEVGAAMADVDLGIRLRRRGFRCQMAVTSQIEFPGALEDLPKAAGFEFGKSVTRMRQRYAEDLGDAGGLSSGLRTAMGDLFRATPLVGAVPIWRGRLAAKLSRDVVPSPWQDSRETMPTESPTTEVATEVKHEVEEEENGEWHEGQYRRVDASHSHASARKRRAMRREFECG